MIYLLLAAPLLFATMLLFRAVACASPHIRLDNDAQEAKKGAPHASAEETPQNDSSDSPAASEPRSQAPESDEPDAASPHGETDAPIPEAQERGTLLVCAARYTPDAFDSFLAVSYPHLAARMRVQTVSRSLLLSLDCGAPEAQCVLVCALLDARDASVLHPPRNPFFDGSECGGYSRAVAALDALEHLAAENAPLTRHIRLLLATDEGDLPAAVQALCQTQERYLCALCEGGCVAPFGHSRRNRIAAVGIGVRAHALYSLDVRRDADDLAAQSAVQIAARAALRIEKRPFGMLADGAARIFARYALYENGFFSRIVAVNARLFPLTIRRLTEQYGGADAVRSVARVRELTCDHDGAHAAAQIDCLLTPHTTAEAFEKKLRHRIRDDRICVRLIQSNAPPAPFDETSVGFRAVQKAVKLSFADTNAAPVVLCRAPQAAALEPLCACTLAFSPCGAPLAADSQRVFFENFFLQFC